MRLKATGSEHSPTRALEQLRHIQYHQATLGSSIVTGVSVVFSMSREQLDIFKALGIEKPGVGTDDLIL